MHEGLVPPAPNCERQEPELELPLSARVLERPVERVLKHAFGLGGQYAALALERLS